MYRHTSVPGHHQASAAGDPLHAGRWEQGGPQTSSVQGGCGAGHPQRGHETQPGGPAALPQQGGPDHPQGFTGLSRWWYEDNYDGDNYSNDGSDNDGGGGDFYGDVRTRPNPEDLQHCLNKEVKIILMASQFLQQADVLMIMVVVKLLVMAMMIATRRVLNPNCVMVMIKEMGRQNKMIEFISHLSTLSGIMYK